MRAMAVAIATLVLLGAAPKKAANGERVFDIHTRNGKEQMRMVGLADGGAEIRFADGGALSVVVDTGPQCVADAGLLRAFAAGCTGDTDCRAFEPHVPGLDSCVVVTASAHASGAYGRALTQAAKSARRPDGGPCEFSHEQSVTFGGCEAACVKGMCVRKETKFE